MDAKPIPADSQTPWYAGISRYQWLVLIIASAGWAFDAYEGQIFNVTRNDMLADMLQSDQGQVKKYGDLFLGVFLLGGTAGGLLFGSLADRYGRSPIMIATILMYSVFSGLTYFAENLWQVAVLRFLVAMGVGGEWAVAASLVAEVFPTKARAHAAGIFHASSVLGTWMAALVGILVASQWRYAYLIGVFPALLIVWVRASVKEPEAWKRKRESSDRARMGSFRDLASDKRSLRNTVLATLLAAVGLGTFWAVSVAGQDLVRERLLVDGGTPIEAASVSKFAYGFVQTVGGGLGLLSFGPLCARWGRRKTFIAFQAFALLIVPVLCFAPRSYTEMLWLLPLFGFLTLGMHAGFAIYFPELFPTHLRATGTSLCFNGGRLLAVPVLIASGWLKSVEGIDLKWAVSGLSLLFVLGILVVLGLPETRGQELPE
ncbi:MAG: MFS transporter [Planctomycetaceae bacterium]